MGKSEVEWEAVPRKGPPLRALCFGINVYDNLDPLDNCERDAEQIVQRVRNLSDGGNGMCIAKLHKGDQLKNKAAMTTAVVDFLADIDKENPPR